MFAALKSRVAVADLLRGVIVQAANDACLILAEGIAGSQKAFVDRMNDKARVWGLTATHFENATGFADPGQRTSARDLAALASHVAGTDPSIYAIYSEKEFTWNRIRQLNRNPLLLQYAGVDGIATGSSESAGFGLATTALRQGRRLVLVIHGLDSAKARLDEARRILDWGFSSFERRIAFEAGEQIGVAQVFGGDAWTVPVASKVPVALLVRSDGKDDISARIVYDGPVAAPIRAGDPIARLEVLRDGRMALEFPLQAAVDIPVGGLGQRALGAIYEIGVGLVRGGTTGQ